MGINYFYQLLIVAIRTDIYRLYKGPSTVLYRVIDIRYRAVQEYIHNVIKIPFHIPKLVFFPFLFNITMKYLTRLLNFYNQLKNPFILSTSSFEIHLHVSVYYTVNWMFVNFHTFTPPSSFIRYFIHSFSNIFSLISPSKQLDVIKIADNPPKKLKKKLCRLHRPKF